jgi:hypothetical protein
VTTNKKHPKHDEHRKIDDCRKVRGDGDNGGNHAAANEFLKASQGKYLQST